jgi:cation diffusion facilitator family transporter
MNADKRKINAAWLSVISNTLLVLLKIIIGILIGSVSVLSEAIHSGVDLLAAVVALFAVKTSSKSADEGHPFGHGKVENISGAVEALLIFVAAGWIIYEAALKLIRPQAIDRAFLGFGVMLLSAVVNIFISRKLFKVGRETDSVALLADAWHLRTDVFTSVGVMAGLGLIAAGGKIFPGWILTWVDPVAAILVALMIIRAAYELTIQSGRDLLDANLPEEEKWIRNEISRLQLPIRGFHHLRTRKAGATRFVDLHVMMDKNLSIQESHRISEQVTAMIQKKFPTAQVMVHEEPCEGECSIRCVDGCLRSDGERKSMQTCSDR